MIYPELVAKAEFKWFAPETNFTMQGLWRLVVWGATAVTATLIVVIASRGVTGTQRASVAMSSFAGSSLAGSSAASTRPGQAARPLDAQVEATRLSEAVQNLTADDDVIKSRLAAIEHNIDDVTGSIGQQIESARIAAARASPWPIGPPVPTTTAAIAAVVTPVLPLPIAYGVDIGSSLSIQALRARWAGIRSAHPELFELLSPTVTLKETPRTNRAELRLVVGPLTDIDAAVQICAALAPYRLFCQPTIFAGQHLALQ
jgi:hypothetical protein